MSRIAKIDIELKKNSKVRTILLFLMDEDDPVSRLRKLRTGKDGKGEAEVVVPGRYKIIWFATGDAGGAITLVVRESGRVLAELTKEKSVIRDGDRDNGGRLRVLMDEATAGGAA